VFVSVPNAAMNSFINSFLIPASGSYIATAQSPSTLWNF
jgi:hypothetical protein